MGLIPLYQVLANNIHLNRPNDKEIKNINYLVLYWNIFMYEPTFYDSTL